MPDRLINGALGGFSSVDMRNGNAGHEGSQRGGGQFIAVPQQEQHVRFKVIECICKSNQAQTHGFGNGGRRVCRKQHFHLLINTKSIFFYLPPGQTEFRRKMGAGHNELQFQIVGPGNSLKQKIQQSIFRPGSRHCAYFSFHSSIISSV